MCLHGSNANCCAPYPRALLAILAYKVLDIATAILIFFVVNVVYFLSAYVITKVS